ncbi:MAG TPA: bifunctional precorrin-2 dehydrogenase/sirohydrochlorin ferrochelatase [Acidimicrobiales bacterium]|jgi:siroheme synthase-like protein|nr:bifunctional precorrin-2 dehydrogenase/sirohydrochlorin ferrochelatase [Acidimicrobiales bacterium]
MPVEGPQYPANLVLQGRRVLVVGAGAIAARKVEGLLACGADVVVVAPVVGEAIAALAAAGAVDLCQRAYRADDLDAVWLAVTATDDRAVNRAVFSDGEARRIWVNAADDPVSCSFTLPSVVRQGPIMVTVATGGHSPALATWLGRHVAGELGPEYAQLALLLAEARAALQAEGRSTEGLNWLSAIDSGMLEMIRLGDVGRAKERLQACLSS